LLNRQHFAVVRLMPEVTSILFAQHVTECAVPGVDRIEFGHFER
jgi:hypothetical protein